MAGERLELLRQRFLETSSVEDEARWIRERLRTGDLERKKAQTAATLGHPGVRLALDSQDKPTKKLRAAFHVLAQLNMEALLRGTALLLRASTAELVRGERAPVLLFRAITGRQGRGKLVLLALDELEAWLVRPSPEQRDAVLRAIASLPAAVGARQWRSPIEALRGVADWLESGVHEESRFLLPLLPFRLAPRGFLKTLKSQLIPWILGYGDPLRSAENSP